MSVKILAIIIGNVHSIYGMMLLFGATPAVFAQSKQLVQKSEILLIFCLPSNLVKISLHGHCMQSILSGFGVIATYQIEPNFPFSPWTIVHGQQKLN